MEVTEQIYVILKFTCTAEATSSVHQLELFSEVY